MLSETKQNPCLPFRSLFATPRAAYTASLEDLLRSDRPECAESRCKRASTNCCLSDCYYFFSFDATTFRRNRLLVDDCKMMIFLRVPSSESKKKNVRSFIYIVCRFEKSCDATIRRRFLVCLSDANFVSRALSTKYAISLSVVQKIMAVIP